MFACVSVLKSCFSSVASAAPDISYARVEQGEELDEGFASPLESHGISASPVPMTFAADPVPTRRSSAPRRLSSATVQPSTAADEEDYFSSLGLAPTLKEIPVIKTTSVPESKFSASVLLGDEDEEDSNAAPQQEDFLDLDEFVSSNA